MTNPVDVVTKPKSKASKSSKRSLNQHTGNTRKPCGRCRNLHLRCVWTSSDPQASCARCERSGNDCVLGTKKTRFRHAVFPNYDHKNSGNEKSHSFIDMPTPVDNDEAEVENIENGDQKLRLWDSSQVSAFYAGLWGTRSLTNEYQYTNFSKSLASPENILPSDTAALAVEHRIQQTGTVSDSAQLFNQSIIVRSTDKAYLEYVLMRYFCEDLAPWLDWCDPDRHFTVVIPQKARVAGPLRNSLLTFAARSLARNRRYRNNAGALEWRGHLLPDLDADVAVFYHNESIRDLLQFSMDPEKLHDEMLLAAVVTLRNDEEIGFHTDEDQEDQQLFRHLANVFISSQLPKSLARQHTSFIPAGSTPESQTQTSSFRLDQEYCLVGNGLRDACIWTAFRQDIHAAMLTGQPLMFPLTQFEAFRQVHPAADPVWANRMVLLCADVTEFAYGSNSPDDGRVPPDCNNRDRWVELKHREQIITKLLPATFQPIFYREPSLLNGVFPEAWFQDMPVICGLTYIELARLLLEKFDPARQHLDASSHAARRLSIAGARKILLRLCGISLSNDHCPPSLINACLGIALVGEYFDDPIERKGLLNVLALMYDRHSYPALSNKIADSLRRSWSSNQRVG